jgi:hypothetical protein
VPESVMTLQPNCCHSLRKSGPAGLVSSLEV